MLNLFLYTVVVFLYSRDSSFFLYITYIYIIYLYTYMYTSIQVYIRRLQHIIIYIIQK